MHPDILCLSFDLCLAFFQQINVHDITVQRVIVPRVNHILSSSNHSFCFTVHVSKLWTMFHFLQVMEMLDNSMLKHQSPEKYQQRLKNLPRILLIQAVVDPNFLNNPQKVGEQIAKTMYTDKDRNTSVMLMVCNHSCVLFTTKTVGGGQNVTWSRWHSFV